MQQLSKSSIAEQADSGAQHHLLMVGLGNPGREYLNTRHNIGFMTIDEMANYYNISLTNKNNLKAVIGQATILSCKLLLVKPTVYMNLSGITLQMILSYYKLPLETAYIIHDDIDLPLGKIKYKFSGGSGGHNGLKSLDEQVGSKYHRIRIGVGRPTYKEEVANYVLEPFTSDERAIINQSIKMIVSNLELIIKNNLGEFNKVIAI